MKLKYNAPVSLTFALICAAVLAADKHVIPGLIDSLFTAEGNMTFRMDSVIAYVRVITHIFGHGSWGHLLKNMMLILLLGPTLEEKHGSGSLIWIMFLTALINGLVNGLFFSTELTGSSGIVFMMILLASFANIKTGELPLTFPFVFLLYIVNEVIAIFDDTEELRQISQISHIIGGLCGSIFGLSKMVIQRKKRTPPSSMGEGNQTVVG